MYYIFNVENVHFNIPSWQNKNKILTNLKVKTDIHSFGQINPS